MIDDLTGIAEPGLAVRYFWRNTATGTADTTGDAVPVVDFSATGSRRLPANGTTAGDPISLVLSGYLDAPESDLYRIAIQTDAGATVTLSIGGQSVALDQNANEWTNADPISLTGGELTRIDLTVANVRSNLALRWSTPSRGWEIIPARHLVSATLIDDLRQTFIRFFKAASLASGLRLTTRELAHLAAHGDYRIDGQGWLNALPVAGHPNVARSASLRDVLVALLHFVALKAAISPDDERLLDVLQDPAATLPNGDARLLTVTGWQGESLDALLARFGKTRADLASIAVFRRVANAFQHVAALGIPATALIAAATNEPTATTVRNLQSALRARYAEADWRAVAKPINDALRGRQRDALVAYILLKMGGSRPPGTSTRRTGCSSTS